MIKLVLRQKVALISHLKTIFDVYVDLHNVQKVDVVIALFQNKIQSQFSFEIKIYGAFRGNFEIVLIFIKIWLFKKNQLKNRDRVDTKNSGNKCKMILNISKIEDKKNAPNVYINSVSQNEYSNS